MKFKTKKREPSQLEKLLGTPDMNVQAERVQALMRPIFTLAIQFDMRTGQLGISQVGAPIPTDLAHQMLDGARRVIIQKEKKQREATPTPPAPPNEAG